MVRLSKRMEGVAGLITAGVVLADVGTDHAYVPIALVERAKIPRAIAMDIGEGPLARARANIAAAGLQEKIETRLSNGFQKLSPGEVDSVLIAGMGGELTIQILSAGEEVCRKVRELILQPQSDIQKVRGFLRHHGYRIEAEDMVCEDGKFYPMMRAVHGDSCESDGDDWTRLADLYGPRLIESGHPLLCRYLEKEHEKLEQILAELRGQPESESICARIRRVQDLLNDNKKVYGQMGEIICRNTR